MPATGELAVVSRFAVSHYNVLNWHNVLIMSHVKLKKPVLPLNSPRWSELRHAYGPASDIPQLLARLEALPRFQGEAEPWFTLWSSLAHQGDVFSASFAAVPHVIEAFSRAPLNADSGYLQFPAWIEVCDCRSR